MQSYVGRRLDPIISALRVGITEDGRKVLLRLAPGTKEDTASSTAIFGALKRRGLADPLLAVTDGAPGLIRAGETRFPGPYASAAWSTGCGIWTARRPTTRGP